MDAVSALLIIAHAGHWLLSLVYVAPVLVILGFIGHQNRQDRRQPRADEPSTATSSPAE